MASTPDKIQVVVEVVPAEIVKIRAYREFYTAVAKLTLDGTLWEDACIQVAQERGVFSEEGR